MDRRVMETVSAETQVTTAYEPTREQALDSDTPADQSTPVSTTLRAFERARLEALINDSNVKLSRSTRIRLCILGLRCCHGSPAVLRAEFVCHAILFIMACSYHFLIATTMSYTCVPAVSNPLIFIPCLVDQLDFESAMRSNDTLITSEMQSFVDGWEKERKEGTWLSQMGALHDLFIAAESADNGTTVRYAADGRGSQTQEGKLSLAYALQGWKVGLGLDATAPTTTTTMDWLASYYEMRKLGYATRVQWVDGNDFWDQKSALMTLLNYFDQTVQALNRFSVVLYVKWLFAKMSLKDLNPTPILYSVAVADVASRGDSSRCEVRSRTDRMLLKNILLVTGPLFVIFGIAVYSFFIPNYPWSSMMRIFSWAAALGTAQTFGCLPLIWTNIDTHLRNVRGTASLVLRNAPPEIIAKNYADTVASLQLFCDLYSPVMLGCIAAAGFAALTNTLFVAHGIMTAKLNEEVQVTPIIVISSTGVALMSLLWKISRVHVEHQRLAMLVSYRRLNGALTGLHALAAHRGTVLLFKNTPLTPAAIRLVPEVIGSVLVAALIPVLGRELQGEVQ
eukprot:g6069.t1